MCIELTNHVFDSFQFLDLFGDTNAIKKADNRHAKHFLRQKTTLGSKKRSAEDFLSSDRTKLARTSTDVPSSTQSVAGAYPYLQSQWTSASVAQTQAWQLPQAPGQNWSTGYNQQVSDQNLLYILCFHVHNRFCACYCLFLFCCNHNGHLAA